MEFTQKEEKLLKLLKLKHENWKSTKWIIFICSVIILTFGLLSQFEIYTVYKTEFPFFIIGGLVGIAYSIGHWNGRPEVSLLLKLLEKEMMENN